MLSRRHWVMLGIVLAAALAAAGLLLMQTPSSAQKTVTTAETPVEPLTENGGFNLSEQPLVRGEVSGESSETRKGLRIASLNVDAAISQVGLNPDGSAQVPHDPQTVGWYQPLGLPDGVGNDVIVGHVSYGSEPGAFHDLDKLQKGDMVTVNFHGQRDYMVSEVTSYAKEDTPLAALYSPNGPAQLVLITCGGEFNQDINHYDRNIVVVAVPA